MIKKAALAWMLGGFFLFCFHVRLFKRFLMKEFVLIMAFSLQSQASPFPPSAKCRVQGVVEARLGIRSYAHADLSKKAPKVRPHACSTSAQIETLKAESFRVRIEKSLGAENGSLIECPNPGANITVFRLKNSKLPAKFEGEIEYRGDECFSGQFLKLQGD